MNDNNSNRKSGAQSPVPVSQANTGSDSNSRLFLTSSPPPHTTMPLSQVWPAAAYVGYEQSVAARLGNGGPYPPPQQFRSYYPYGDGVPPEQPYARYNDGPKSEGPGSDSNVYILPDNRGGVSLPPFSTIASSPARAPSEKDEFREFDEGLSARILSATSGNSSGDEYSEGLAARLLERTRTDSGSRQADDFGGNNSVQTYRPWEMSPTGGDPPTPTSSSHAPPATPTSSANTTAGGMTRAPSRPSSEMSLTPTPAPTPPTSIGYQETYPKYATMKEVCSKNDQDNRGGDPDTKPTWYHPPIKQAKESISPEKQQQQNHNNSNKNNSSLLMPADDHQMYNNNNGSDGDGKNQSGGPSYSPFSEGSNSGAAPAIHYPQNNFEYFPQPHSPAHHGAPWEFRDGPPPPIIAKTANGDSSIPSPGGDQSSKYTIMTNYLSPGFADARVMPNSGAQHYAQQNGDVNAYGNGIYGKQYPSQNLINETLQSLANPQQYLLPKGDLNSDVGHHMGMLRAGEVAGQVPSVSSTVPHHPPNSQMGGHVPRMEVPHKGHHHHAHAGGDGPGAVNHDAPVKQKKQKRKRCGDCFGCSKKDNCGECAPCRNEKSHQICKMRRCEKLIEKKGSHHNNNANNQQAAPAQNIQPPQGLVPPNHMDQMDKLPSMETKVSGGPGWW